MKSILAFPLAALLALAAMPALSHAGGLETFAWKNRVLLVFAPSENRAVESQRRLMAAETAALAERDMVVLLVTQDRVEPLFGSAPGISAEALRAQAGVAAQTAFSAVLIGKDGGVKLRQDRPVTAEALFGLVDSMPMRAGEARR